MENNNNSNNNNSNNEIKKNSNIDNPTDYDRSRKQVNEDKNHVDKSNHEDDNRDKNKKRKKRSKERDYSSRRDRSYSRNSHRRNNRSRSRDSHRRNNRSRSRDVSRRGRHDKYNESSNRKSDKKRSNSRSNRHNKRERSKDRSLSKSHDRKTKKRSKSKNQSKERKPKDIEPKQKSASPPQPPQTSGQQPTMSLTAFLKANPQMGVQEAILKMKMLNSVTSNFSTPNIPSELNPITSSLNPNINPYINKLARELYVGNLPNGTLAPNLVEFLNVFMVQMGISTPPGNPVLNAWLSSDGHYAFCEFRTIEETNSLLNLGTIPFNNTQLKVGRPKSYIGPSSTLLPAPPIFPLVSPSVLPKYNNSSILTTIGANFDSSAILVMNLPIEFTDEEARSLVEAFGELKGFNLLKDSFGKSKGCAIYDFVDSINAQHTIEGLNGFKIGSERLLIQRVPPQYIPILLQSIPITNGTDNCNENTTTSENESNVLIIKNLLQISDLGDDEEYGFIKEEITQECDKFGFLKSIYIPRQNQSNLTNSDIVGNVYVEYYDDENAKTAKESLEGRNFDGKTVSIEYFPYDLYIEQFSELASNISFNFSSNTYSTIENNNNNVLNDVVD